MRRLIERMTALPVVFLITTVVHGALTRGRPRFALDTSIYITVADRLRAGHMASGFASLLRGTKIVFIVVVATARAMSASHWAVLVVVFNVLCSAVTAVLIVDVARRATKSSIAPAIALLFYLGSFEVFQWLPYVLTDPLYLLESFAIFYIAARAAMGDAVRYQVPLLAMMITAATFTRPPGFVLLPLTILIYALYVWPIGRRARLAVGCVVVVGAIASLAVRTAVFYDPSTWPFRFGKDLLVQLAQRENTGEVVWDEHDSYRPRPATRADHVVIVADRSLRLFQFIVGSYSRRHNLMNAVYFVPLYALALIGVIHALRSNDADLRALAAAALIWIGSFAFFHGLTVIDWDWRMRVPLMPQLILLAACGAHAALIRFTRADRSPRQARTQAA